jgi:FixJ family two-component response regulator
MKGPSRTVFVVDDDASVRKSLARLLTTTGHRVDTFGSAGEFLKRGPRPPGPACLILDLSMPEVSGLDLQAMLHDSGTSLPVLFATGHGDVPASVRAMKQGAVDFLTKPIDEAELLAAVGRALSLDEERGQAEAALAVLEERQARLTPRERQVLGLVVTGMLNKQIAGRLGASERTIKAHRARVMQKMQAGSVAELVRMADRLGVVAPQSPAYWPKGGYRRTRQRSIMP